MGTIRFLIVLLLVAMNTWQLIANDNLNDVREIINRFTGNTQLLIELKIVKCANRQFSVKVENGVLKIEGSDKIALCRGFYDYVKTSKCGLLSWSGKRCDLPKVLKDMKPYKVISPFKHHYYLNVVTFGYSMPYWNWERWEQEIEWMALHGIDMPLALVASEAIYERVLLKIGLSKEEIRNYFVGPAHLPWMRMGNISGIDGPLTDEWQIRQIELQHKILKKMKGLGMKPICPGFAGFVPQDLKRVYPEVKITETSWAGSFHNWILSPEDPLFFKIGKMFIEEWEREFGKNYYYIVDSFNEMDIPFPPKNNPERYTLLASYGNQVYNSIKAGNKDAVWVMQGWMFGYNRSIWDYETLKALLSKVPDEKMLLLDLAVDYNRHFWKIEVNWDFYKGFFNKPWVYSVIPNMGGKSGLTGILSFYANGQLDALSSENKGRLVGFGMAPEGIENNEVIYELLCDAGWSSRNIDVKEWLKSYSISRYGKCPDKLMSFWIYMISSVYGTFTDHPRYNWQFRPGLVRNGSINSNSAFEKGVELLSTIAPEFSESPLFEYDFAQWTSAYIGGKLEILVRKIEDAYASDDKKLAQEYEKVFESLMLKMDAILSNFSNTNMQTWIDMARAYGTNNEEADMYESNARRIITVWGPPIDDYSARIWSGLIRDYYLPRWKYYFSQKRTGEKFDFCKWEDNWVKKVKGFTPIEKVDDIINSSISLIKDASSIHEKNSFDRILSYWKLDKEAEDTILNFAVSIKDLKNLKRICFCCKKKNESVVISSVSILADGEKIWSILDEKIASPSCFYKLENLRQINGNNSLYIEVKMRNVKRESSGIIKLMY